MVNLSSFWRGIMAIQKPYVELRPGWGCRWQRGWWCHLWTPTWHRGRGPYISIGLGVFTIYRGY